MKKNRNNKFKIFFVSALSGIVCAGLFSAILFAIAADRETPYGLGETLNPTCSHDEANCTVVTPAAYAFDGNNFSGTGNISTTGNASFASLNLTALALSVGNGGTGISTTPTGGQILIGKSNGTYTLTGLTAGDGISITPGDGTITIASSFDASGFVPYTGATSALDLGSQNLYTTGNVGFGTASPVHALDVYTSTVPGGIISLFKNTSNADTAFQVQNSIAAWQFSVRESNDSNPGGFNFYYSPDGSNDWVNAMNLSTSGSISIPSGSLTVSGSGNSSFAGNVGIGTTNPFVKFQVEPTYSTTTPSMIVGHGNPGSGDYNQLQIGINANGQGGGTRYVWLQAIQTGSGGNSLSLNPIGGNVGIGTTTPAAKLNIASGGVGTYSLIRLESGTNVSGEGSQIDFKNMIDGNSAWARIGGYREGAANYRSYLAFFTDATGSTGGSSLAERMRISSDGYVGIGTTSPDSLLDVAADQNAHTGITVQNLASTSNTGADAEIILKTVDSSGYVASFHSASSLGDLYRDRIVLGANSISTGVTLMANGTGQDIRLVSPAGESVRINSSGNVGIGTTNPQRKLWVTNDGSVAQIGLETTAGSANQHYWGLKAASDGSFAINSMSDALAATSRIFINSSGNVGIGTTSPNYPINVYSNANTMTGIGIDNVNGTGTQAGGGFFVNSYTDSSRSSFNSYGAFYAYQGGVTVSMYGLTMAKYVSVLASVGNGLVLGTGFNNAPIIFGTNNAERMRITGDGKVGIGTATPAASFSINSISALSTREMIMKANVNDAGTSAFYVYNSTVNDNVFVPAFVGMQNSNSTNSSLAFQGIITSANDTGTGPIVTFTVQQSTSTTDPLNGTLSAITTRPLFDFLNQGTSVMRILASGKVGIGTTTPNARIESLATTEQLRLSYNSTYYASFVTDSLGNLTITPNGGITTIAGKLQVGTDAEASGDYSVAFGNATTASGVSASVFGESSTASGYASLAAGSNAVASGGYSIALGANNSAVSTSSVAIGGSNVAGGEGYFQVALGFNSQATADASVAIGDSSLASATSALAIAGGQASGDSSIAIGTSSASGDGSVVIGQNLGAEGTGTIVFGSGLTVSTASSFNVGFGSGLTTPDFQVVSGAATVNGTLTATTLATGVESTSPSGSCTDGSIKISSSATTPGIYYCYGGAWHYSDQTSGFQIPSYESVDPVTGERMAAGDFVIPMLNAVYDDGTAHGVWVKWSTVKSELLAELSTSAISGYAGSGTVSTVNADTTSITEKVKNVLGALGISISNGVTNIAKLASEKFTADTATVNYLQMVASNGDIYCTWIDENGNWQKVKGECSSQSLKTEESSQNSSPAGLSEVQAESESSGSSSVAEAEAAAQAAARAAAAAQNAASAAQNAAAAVNENVHSEPAAALNIVSVSSISDMILEYGSLPNLPTTVQVVLSDGISAAPSVVWDSGTPAFDQNTPGTYIFTGTLATSQSVTNTNSLQAGVNVTIKEQPIVEPEVQELPTQQEEASSQAESDPLSAGNLISSATASFLSGAWQFLQWVFGSVSRQSSMLIPDSLEHSTASLALSIADGFSTAASELSWQIDQAINQISAPFEK